MIIYVGLFIIGLVIRYGCGVNSDAWNLWGTLDVSSAVSLAVLAFLAYRDMMRDEDEVSLLFQVNGERVYDTGFSLLRKDCTRAEIIGLLGMIQTDTGSRFRYNTDPNRVKELLLNVNEVRKGKARKIIIKLSKEEARQFITVFPDKFLNGKNGK